MPLIVVRAEPTPNPNATKFVLNGRVVPEGSPSASFRSLEQANAQPLARALMACAGVTGVLLCNDWITINRSSPADSWKSIRAALEKSLAQYT